jgi:glycosyltransferase involved in cell wall biosynthesis
MILKKNILIITDFFYPGHKAGGPVRTLLNTINALKTEYNFYIICKNHDFGDKKPYENLVFNKWTKIEEFNVYYCDKRSWNLRGLKKIIFGIKYDLIYLNSIFSLKSTLYTLFISKIFLKNNKFIIAPRGQFSVDAFKNKPFIKTIYLFFFKVLISNFKVLFQASSQIEKNDIINFLPKIDKSTIKIAPNIPEQNFSKRRSLSSFKKDEKLNLVFVSRIHRIKNLNFLIDVLKNLKTNVKLDIYGIIEDKEYFSELISQINEFKLQNLVNYKRDLKPNEVLDILSNYDLFVLPTKSENFGHVIYESCRSGTPVLISNKTPWFTQDDGSITTINLEITNWVKILEEWGDFTQKDLFEKHLATLDFAKKYLNKNDSVNKFKHIVETLL